MEIFDYQIQLLAMPHSAESIFSSSYPKFFVLFWRLPTVPHRAELRFRAMRHSAEFFFKNFIANYALCNFALCRIAQSQQYLQISLRNQSKNQNYFRMIISDLGRLDGEKNQGLKIS
jgi:hypothetical protein